MVVLLRKHRRRSCCAYSKTLVPLKLVLFRAHQSRICFADSEPFPNWITQAHACTPFCSKTATTHQKSIAAQHLVAKFKAKRCRNRSARDYIQKTYRYLYKNAKHLGNDVATSNLRKILPVCMILDTFLGAVIRNRKPKAAYL